MNAKSESNRRRKGKYKWSEKARENRRNENNPNWKGDKAGYTPIHIWVKARKPKPQICERCSKKGFLDLANISQEYKRDVEDFIWLCRSCHMKEDGRLNKLHQRRREHAMLFMQRGN